MSVIEYLGKYLSQEPLLATEIIDWQLYGRVLHGRPDDEQAFESLKPNGPAYVMVTGTRGLSQYIGKTGREIVEAIGYTPEYILEQQTEGEVFKLAVFAASEAAFLADWAGVGRVIQLAYPAALPIWEMYCDLLGETPYQQIEPSPGYFAATKYPNHPEYMSYESLCCLPNPTLINLRAFLYHVLRLREPYLGNGLTLPNGGVEEYFVANQALDEFEESMLIDLDV